MCMNVDIGKWWNVRTIHFRFEEQTEISAKNLPIISFTAFRFRLGKSCFSLPDKGLDDDDKDEI